jgi:hypothetical protein
MCLPQDSHAMLRVSYTCNPITRSDAGACDNRAGAVHDEGKRS